ncbi:ABC transporter permease [Myxococcota bacterium]|nr:ABC transporter permease [Myxococcota bacterium]
MELEAGECLWLKGDSGAGKSSIALHLLGLRPLRDAQVGVVWEGVDETNRAFGMVFQQGVLIDSLNVGENIGLAIRRAGGSASREAIRKALTEVGLAETDTSKMPGQLSGGMLRRASLAQVLAQGRPVIVLDEPFVGLDPTNARGIVSLIQDLMARGQSFILISHEDQFAAPLATPGREVQLVAHPVSDVTPRNRLMPHWSFFVRTSRRLFDYLVISAPLILFAFMAAGIAISMLFSELLEATNVDSLRRQIIDPNPSFMEKLFGVTLFQKFVGYEFDRIASEHLPEIRRRVFAMGISRGFIIELGPMLTALLLAGRIGGSYAGEVSMMQATHQNQLLRTLGVSPRKWTLGPAAIAALIAAPVLTAIGVGTSLLMARVVALSSGYELFANGEQYWQAISEKALVYQSLWTYPPFVCFYHSMIFMILILGVSEAFGRLRPDIQPRDVPRAITWAVVGASLAIIVADWGLAQWLLYLQPIQNFLE